MKALFLTEGSGTFGYGHITRCTAIAQGLSERSIESDFIVYGDASIDKLITNYSYSHQKWIHGLKKPNLSTYEYVFIDSYLAPLSTYLSIRKYSKQLICLDDNSRLNYPCDVVINGSIGAVRKNYPQLTKAKLLLGAKYTPLRHVFWKKSTKVINENIAEILITMGGTDIQNLSPKIIDLLQTSGLIEQAVVIIGDGFSQWSKKRIMSFKKVKKIVQSPTSSQIAELMLSADVAISAGGQTLYELARVGVPTIAIIGAENQMQQVRMWAKTGFIKYAGKWNDSSLMSNLFTVYNQIQNYEVRLKMHNVGKSIMSETGVNNIIDAIL